MDLTTIVQGLLEHFLSEGDLPLDVGCAERVVRGKMLALGLLVLKKHFQGRKLGDEGSSCRCVCGGRRKFAGYRQKKVVTWLGQLPLDRAYYHGRDCGGSSRPYDQRVGLCSQAASPGVAKAACLLGIEVPFAQAQSMLFELCGIVLSESTLSRLTYRAGAKADEIEQEDARRKEDWSVPEDLPGGGPVVGRLYNSADGTMVHTLEPWREVKTHVCYWKDAQENHQARYRCRLEGIEAFVAHAFALSSRGGLDKCRQSVLIGDGAAWIWDRLGPVFDEAVQIVDWYHASEHVWSCAKAVYGEGTPVCQSWGDAKETLLWNGRRKRLIEELQSEHDRLRSASKRAALQALVTCLNNQGSRLDYPVFRDQGLDIGSGTVESACRHVVQSRMKRAGTRWSLPCAQAVLSLRCCRLNGQGDTFWNARPLAA